MNEEALKMYAELTQEVSLCQDEDIKALGKGILKLANNYDKSLKEIERLNNIINNGKERIEELKERTKDISWVEFEREDYCKELDSIFRGDK